MQQFEQKLVVKSNISTLILELESLVVPHQTLLIDEVLMKKTRGFNDLLLNPGEQ